MRPDQNLCVALSCCPTIGSLKWAALSGQGDLAELLFLFPPEPDPAGCPLLRAAQSTLDRDSPEAGPCSVGLVPLLSVQRSSPSEDRDVAAGSPQLYAGDKRAYKISRL